MVLRNRFNLRYSPFRLILACLLILCLKDVCAKADSTSLSRAFKRPDFYIDDEQKRIDLLDSTADERVKLDDSATTAKTHRIYFVLVDSLQRLIDNPQFDDARKKTFRDVIYLQLRKVNRVSVYQVARFETVFRFLEGELNAMLQKNLNSFLATNIDQAFSTFGVIKREDNLDSFLIFAALYRPDLVFQNYDNYKGRDFSLHVIEEAAKIAPVTVKRYFNPNNPIYLALKTSKDTSVKVILEIKDKYTRKSNAYTLLDGIMAGDYNMAQADSIGNNPRAFLRAMIKIRTKKAPLAVHSLEDDLAIYSLKFVRVLNDLHMDADEVRFASIENFTAEEMYTLMVYSEEEIFTSTFNGLFNRMMVKLGPVSGYDFLQSVGDNRFRTFIKMCAGFGKMTPFLQSMNALYEQMLMIKFASGLEKYNDLSQAVEVADAFGSISDSLVLKILRNTIKLEYIKLSTKGDARGRAIYGLLSSLFVERSLSNTDWFASISKQYAIPAVDHININKLFNRDGTSRWLIYFYDDEDGLASFSTFAKAFADPNWKIIDSGMFVIIQSRKGEHVEIYANKPKFEYDGQARLEKIFAGNDYEPNVMVHRGHSYYAFKTIEKVRDNTQIFVLGSCGGYHSLSSIIERSPDVSIISSKQIGTRFVNNPMLKLMAESIRQGKDIQWQNLWNDLDKAVKDNTQAHERFLDYIPPHKNLGAIFIKTYNKMMEQP
jgi:hypothetical protein